MAESSGSGLHRMQDAVGKISGKQGFREWKKKLRNGVNLYVPDLKPILDGAIRPAETAPTEGAGAAWDKANDRFFSLLFFVTDGSAHNTILAHEEAADGAAAWKALNARFDANTQEARRACHRELFGLRHLAGGDPVDFFTKGMDLKIRLRGLGEEVSDDVFLDVMLSGLTTAPEFKFIRDMHYRDEFTSVDRLQETANRFYVDQQSRNESGPVVSGRGAAMAASSSDQCHRCKAYGHFQRDCPQQQSKGPKNNQKPGKKPGKKPWKNKRGGGGGSAQPKWCSYHNTTTHSDAECQKQQELRANKQKELQGLVANLALLHTAGQVNLPSIGAAHLAQSVPATAPPAPAVSPSIGFSFSTQGVSPAAAAPSSAFSQTPSQASAATPAAPASVSSASPAQDHRLPSGFFGAFMATPAEMSLAPFRSDGSCIRMVVDSGATDNYLDPALTPGLRAHMCDVEDLQVPHTIVAAGQHLLKGVTTGTIFGAVTDDSGNDRSVSFRVVLVPGLGTNLFSVTAAMQKGVATLFHPASPRLESGDAVIPMQTCGVDDATGKLICSIEVKLGGGAGKLMVLGRAPDGLALKTESAELWHRRMGHINGKSLDVLRKEPGNGVDYTGDVKNCSTCLLGKSAQQPHPKQATYGPLRPFQLVYVDTLGPFTPTSLGGFKYAIKFVDQKTKWKEAVLMKDKTGSADALEVYNKETVIPTGERIYTLRGDRGTEFTSSEFRRCAEDLGIQLQFTSPYTPQQIGSNERAGRTILNIVRCLLADATLPNFLWGELMKTAVYLSNRTPHAALQNGTPYKALYGKDAHLGNLRVIGARAFVHEETHTRKLEHRAWEGRLIGFSEESKSYRIYNPRTRSVRVSQNVTFIETPGVAPSSDARGFDDGEFTYDDHDDMLRDVRNYTSNHSVDSIPPEHAVGDLSAIELLEQIVETTNRDLGLAPTGSPTADDAPGTSGGTSEGDSPVPPGGVTPPAPGSGASSSGSSPGPAPPLGSPPAGSVTSGTGSVRGRGSSRGERGSAPTPAVTRSASQGGSARGGITQRGGRGSGSARGRGSRGGRGSTSTPATTRSASSVPTAKTVSELRRLSYAFPAKGEFPDVAHRDGTFGFTEYAYTVGTTQPNVPRTIKEARATPEAAQWNAAAEREIASLKDRKVYKLVPRSAVPAGRKRINSKWVFKRKADGSFKGRVVAQGWNQVPGLDSGSIHAPVCMIQSVRIICCIAVHFALLLHQMDVSTAFLYADIQELVFVEQPPGFEVKDKDGGELVMKLEKSLYGLAQSPGNWFNTIDPALVEIGFVPLQSDTCVYLYDHDGVRIYLTLYVDDLLLASNNSNAMAMVKEKLKHRFKMTDMGPVSLVLGMEIKRDLELGTLTISQEAYSKSILERFGMSECKPTTTPGYGSELSNQQPEETLLDEDEKKRYQGIVGCLMYVSQVLRYDIMYAVGQLARPMAKPSKIHMVAAKHTLRYLAGTTKFSITYKRGSFNLAVFTDSNWANNPDNGKSTSCYLSMLCDAPIGFKSGLQGLTAMSTMEAELVASALAMKEAVFCSNMLTELGFGKDFAKVPLYCDNTATLHALGNRSFSSRTKHIALRFFFIRELVSEGRISIHYIPTDINPADIGTKHLNKHRFKKLLDIISNFNMNDFINSRFIINSPFN